MADLIRLQRFSDFVSKDEVRILPTKIGQIGLKSSNKASNGPFPTQSGRERLKRHGGYPSVLKKSILFPMSDFRCPKCGGFDYYLSNRNVMKGIGGIWGNRGGVKKFPVCKVCEEIMDSTLEAKPIVERPQLQFLGFVVGGFVLLMLVALLLGS